MKRQIATAITRYLVLVTWLIVLMLVAAFVIPRAIGQLRHTQAAALESPQTPAGLTLLSVVSRMTQGAGTFDISLPPTCPAGIECRSQGGNYTIVVTFSGGNETVASAAVTCHNPGTGTGCVGSAGVCTGTVGGSGTPIITVPLTGVSNAQTLTVHITGTINVDIPMSILIGDVNGNGFVNSADIALDRSPFCGAPLAQANCRCDVTANGAVNAADIALVKANVGINVSPCCP